MRHIPQSLDGWDSEKDKFKGNEKYGDKKDNTKAWSVPFDDKFNKFTVESGDRSYSVTKDKSKDKSSKGMIGEDKLLSDKKEMKKLGGANVYI